MKKAWLDTLADVLTTSRIAVPFSKAPQRRSPDSL